MFKWTKFWIKSISTWVCGSIVHIRPWLNILIGVWFYNGQSQPFAIINRSDDAKLFFFFFCIFFLFSLRRQPMIHKQAEGNAESFFSMLFPSNMWWRSFLLANCVIVVSSNFRRKKLFKKLLKKIPKGRRFMPIQSVNNSDLQEASLAYVSCPMPTCCLTITNFQLGWNLSTQMTTWGVWCPLKKGSSTKYFILFQFLREYSQRSMPSELRNTKDASTWRRGGALHASHHRINKWRGVR